MNWRDKRVWIVLIIVIGIIAITVARVFMNIQAQREEARRSGQHKASAVAAAHPLRRSIVPVVRFSGTLDPVWQADVAAKVDGRIEQILVREGQTVSSGTALAVLETTDTAADLLHAEGAWLDAKTNFEKASLDVERYEKLYEAGAVSKETADNYRFGLENARGKLDAAKGALDAARSKANGTVVTTPRCGIVQKRYYQEGYYAKAGTPLFNVADISTLLAKISIPEGYVSSVAVGSTVQFAMPAMSGAAREAEGVITRISTVASQPSRTFEAEVTVDNHDGRLFGGVYADASIRAKPKDDALVVPLSAIVMRDDQRTVYVIEDGVAVRRVIVTGYIGNDQVEVLSGISEADLVITGGQNKIREGSRVKISEEGNGADD